ncbi:uncharacterized protein LOC121389029 [Gigantopelta aegis]|uniref:uncharacterized protein LOC121389029 n=1 Tax=Gigantopelta aegis TaxID=1735272 RepID=UPI001B88BEF0|nr:uncharacterized protein LOC121389029 [Gigantopelta aegis]XP_041376560.1 uncharacterized protein LOC121389029 [Gigantopelta aegis]XP_041376561.1 uncharacterized protein LOC121389029 [Gigantopelta aegis]
MSADSTKKPKCKYWDKCFRNNPAHRKQFLHPEDDTVKAKASSDEEEEEEEYVKPTVMMGESRGKLSKQASDEAMDTSSPTKAAKKNAAKRMAHAMSQSDDEDETDSSPTKKIKPDPKATSTPEKKPAKNDTDKTTDKSTDDSKGEGSRPRRIKCKYWDKCFRKEKQHIKEFCHPDDSDADEAEDADSLKTRSQSKKPLNEMKPGDTVKFDGGVTIKREDDSYTCSCKGWHAQRNPYNKRTCKHLKDYLGSEFERYRCELDEPKPNRSFKSHIAVSLLLAHKYDEKANDPTGWWISEKLDGVRAFWNGRCFYSRLGNAFIAPEWFTKDLPTDMHLDGELFGGRGQFQSTVSIVKTPEDERWKKIKYEVFDSPSLEKEPFEKRYEQLKDYSDKHKPKFAHLCEQTKCTGKAQLDAELKKMIKLGGEGLMIRQPKSKYERTRSRTLLKIKKFYDAEARVIGHEKGKGKNQFCTGALRCKMANGMEFKVGSGLTDANRRKPPKIGSIITYKFQEYTNGGHPRFPTFLGIRIDMDEPKDADVPKKPSDD